MPRHPIRCRESLQTGNYPHSATIRADYIAAFPSTRSRALTPIAVWRAPAFMRLSQADRPRSIRRCALPPAVIATALSDRSCAGCRRPLQRSPFPPTSQVGNDADVRNVAPDRLVGRVGVPDGGPERGSRGGETGARAVRSADESRSSSSRTGARVPRLRLGTLAASRVPRLAVVSRRPSCK